MTMAIVSVLATLLVVLALSWNRFATMERGAILQLALIWAAIIAGLTLLVRALNII